MELKSFYPNLKKIIVSIILTAITWYIIYKIKFTDCTLVDCLQRQTTCTHFPIQLLPICCHGCNTFLVFLNQLTISIIIPFLVFYFVISLMEIFVIKK